MKLVTIWYNNIGVKCDLCGYEHKTIGEKAYRKDGSKRHNRKYLCVPCGEAVQH